MKKTRKNVGGRRRKKTRKDRKKEGNAAERARLSAVARARQKAINKLARNKARESYIKALPYYNEDGHFNTARARMIKNIRDLEHDIDIKEQERSATRKRKQQKQSLNKMVSVGSLFESSNRSKKNSVKKYDNRPRLQRPRSSKKPNKMTNNLIAISKKDIELDRYLEPPRPDFSGLSHGRTLDDLERSEHQVTKPHTRAFDSYLKRLSLRKKIPGASVHFANPENPSQFHILPLNHPKVPYYTKKFGPGKVTPHPGTLILPETNQAGPTYSPLAYPTGNPSPHIHNPNERKRKRDKRFFKRISEYPERFELDGNIYDENLDYLYTAY